ncbi:Alpha/Beta hydrolase protein [Melanogaster broomeanus]|nr:Alpha/Beta hydrolase protein [Melanogaster broomeanus]
MEIAKGVACKTDKENNRELLFYKRGLDRRRKTCNEGTWEHVTEFLGATRASKEKNRNKEAAKDIAAFVAIFFENFSQFKGRPFHMAGESYGGRYLPVFAAEIYDQNAKLVEAGSTPINLQSVMIGNGMTDYYTMTPSYIDMQCTAISVFPFTSIRFQGDGRTWGLRHLLLTHAIGDVVGGEPLAKGWDAINFNKPAGTPSMGVSAGIRSQTHRLTRTLGGGCQPMPGTGMGIITGTRGYTRATAYICQKWTRGSCIDQYDAMNCGVARDFCGKELVETFLETARNARVILTPCATGYEVVSDLGTLNYLDRPSTRTLLGVDPSITSNFTLYSDKVGIAFHNAQDEYHETYTHISALLERGVRALIYVGTYDWICNWVWKRALDTSDAMDLDRRHLRARL